MAGPPSINRKLSHLAALDAELLPAPKTAAELAAPHAPKAFERLARMLDSADEDMAYKASNAILDRAYGKPVQAVAGQFDGKLTISWAVPDDPGVTIDLTATKEADKQ